MSDQAEKLRKLSQKNQSRLRKAIVVTSGKGGVGKSNIALNLGLLLAKKGHKVCLIDGDFSLANLNILLGISYPKDLSHFFKLEINSLQDIIYPTDYDNLFLLPAGSGIKELANLEVSQINNLIFEFSKLEDEFDFIIIDTAAGIHPSVLMFVNAADLAILVLTPEPTSLSDGYALFKLSTNQKFYILINMSKTFNEGKNYYNKFIKLTDKFLQRKPPLLGIIEYDSNVREAVKNQIPIIESSIKSKFSILLQKVVLALTSEESKSLFFDKLRYYEDI